VEIENVIPVGEVIFSEEEFPKVELGSEEDDNQPTVNLASSQLADPIDEPFSDVFQESIPSIPWSSAPSTEEDSPFGLPEPPPAPEPEPEAEIMIEPP